jgi:hypothetical protein
VLPKTPDDDEGSGVFHEAAVAEADQRGQPAAMPARNERSD